jgi:hypothetical protein
MGLPDVPRGRFVWIRPRSHGWVERALQLRLVEFVTVFEDEHPWVRRGTMTVEERFSDTGVNVSVPTGPTAPAQRKDNFLQRNGLPLVKLYCTRERDSRVYEVAVPFPLGNDTQAADTVLAAARESLRVQEKQTR